MKLIEIKTAIASYFELPNGIADLTVNDQDLALLTFNQVRRTAELQHDFEFSRRLVKVTVDGVVGGSLDEAVLYSDSETAVEIKTVNDIGMFDDDGNFIPVEWTTVVESLERQRNDNPRRVPRYRTDDGPTQVPRGQGRFALSGENIFRFPKDSGVDFELGLEVYAFSPDWANLNADADPWTKHGSQFLMWKSVVQLNHLFKHYVFRQEGNLPPPEKLADEGLEAFIAWDSFRYEQNRRHGR